MTVTTLFLSVCNLAASAGWVVLAVMLVRLLLGLPGLRRIPRRFSVVLWAVVALRLVIPFSFESAWSLLPHAQPITQTLLYDPTPTIHTGVPALNAVINEAVMPSVTPNPGDSVNPLQVITAVGAWVWIIGTVLMILYMVISYLYLYRRLRFATKMEGGDNVYECEAVTSPFVLGLFRPRIFLPYHMDAQTRTHVIAHERAHLTRGDHFIKPLAFLLLSVYWFHPLLWAAYILLCRDIEGACDERAAKDMTGAERKAYAAALVHCSVKARQITACPLAFGETGVKHRVTAILDYKRPTLWVLIAAVVLCAVFAVCFGTDPFSVDGMTPMVEYDPIAQVFENGMFSYVQTVETAPSFCVDEDGVLWMRYPDGEEWTSIGMLSEYKLTKDGLQDLFAMYNPDSFGMHETAETLYRQSKAAWRADYIHPSTGAEESYTVMQRDNGDVLVLYSFRYVKEDGTLSDEIPRWIYRLSETNNSVTLPAYDSYRIAYAYAGSPAPDYNEINRMPYADRSADMMTSVPDSLDNDRLQDAVGIPVLRFASADDLRQFRQTYSDAFVFDDSLGDRIPAFDYAVKSFGDSEALFRDNVLLVACIHAPSSSHVFSVSQITAEDGVLAVDIDRYAPELCTDDEISHFVLIAVPRAVMENTETVLVLLENAPSMAEHPVEAIDLSEYAADTTDIQSGVAYEDTPAGSFTIDPDVTVSDAFALYPEDETQPDIEDDTVPGDIIIVPPTE